MKTIKLFLAFVIRFLELKGSWGWAVRQMKNGHMVVTKSTSGAVKYRFSTDAQFRLQCDFHREEKSVKWEDSNFFISYMEATDWQIYTWKQ